MLCRPPPWQIQVITFKIFHGLWPEYINDLYGIKSTSHYSLRCNNELFLELPREKIKRTLVHRAFFAPQ